MKKKIGDIYWGLILIGVGVLFLARNVGYIDFTLSWKIYWPIILIIVGVSLLLRRIKEKEIEVK